MKKQLCSVLLAAALALGMAPTAGAATGTVTYTLGIEDTEENTEQYNITYENGAQHIEVQQGETIEVRYSLSVDPAGVIGTIQNEIYYDHEFFELEEGSWRAVGAYAAGYSAAPRVRNNGKHYVFFNTIEKYEFTTTPTLVGTFRLKVLAPAGSRTTVKNDFLLAYTNTFEEYGVEARDLTVTVVGEDTPPEESSTPGGGLGDLRGSVTVRNGVGGAVSASHTSADQGTTVTVTVAPESGYYVASVRVSNSAGGAIPVKDLGEGKYTFVMPYGGVTVQAVFARELAHPESTGVAGRLNTADHVAYISGYPEGDVRPGSNITRAEVSMILYRLLKDKNVQKSVAFSDVPAGEWYTEAVETLAALGIVNGYPAGGFRPDQPITRAEFATMVARLATGAEEELAFDDLPGDHWARGAIATNARYGWVTGYTDGTFRPENNITRGEVVTIMNRVLYRSADQDYATGHRGELRQFSDLQDPEMWCYYDMVEAINGHEYTTVDGKESWTGLK